MGMFDYLKCEYPLPGNPPPLDGWQTKDTPAQQCERYMIHNDGQLMHEGRAGVFVPVTDFRGAITFYTTDDSNAHEWWEYSALFDKGKLINVVQVAPEPEAEGE